MFRKIFSMVMLLSLMILLGSTATAHANQCTIESGQQFIDAGQYKKAIQEFSCVIDAQPTEVEGYRGRMEAKLMLDKYADAMLDYARVMAVVAPVHPDFKATILDGYAARLSVDPNSITALKGKSFTQWWFYDDPQAIQTMNHLLELQPNSVYGNLFRGSSRLLSGITKNKGIVDLERALALAPQSPDVHFIVSDAYTYGTLDPQRALAEASQALAGGINTPRVHAILASAYAALGNQAQAAIEYKTHIDMVTSEWVTTVPMASDTTLNLDLVAYRTYDIPLNVVAGELISIDTSSPDFWDSILVLIGPDGTPVLGSDDVNFYFAAFDWTAVTTGIYRLQVTSFESTSTGELVVERN